MSEETTPGERVQSKATTLDTGRPPPNQCTATTLSGDRCRQLIPAGAEVCTRHEARKAIRTVNPDELPAGGAPPRTLADVAVWFAWLTVQLATGQVDYRIGREIGHALTGYRGALEKQELSAKVGQLQAKLDAAKGRRRGGGADDGTGGEA